MMGEEKSIFVLGLFRFVSILYAGCLRLAYNVMIHDQYCAPLQKVDGVFAEELLFTASWVGYIFLFSLLVLF